jgi:actin-like ATPase involved in cell morphogenesis
MGLTLEFLIGNSAELSDAIQNVDLDKLDDPAVVKMRADFSLHIEPRDLDHLSRQFGSVVGKVPTDLRSHVQVRVDEEDRGLLDVDDSWVSYVASAPDESASAIAERWASAMREAYHDPELIVTDAMTTAVSSLIVLCKAAKKDSLSVVHIWML